MLVNSFANAYLSVTLPEGGQGTLTRIWNPIFPKT